MGENSSIQWTHHTFNPWVGCTKVSLGCKNCYAEAYDKRVGGVPVKQRVDGAAQLRWGVGAPRTRTSAKNWREPRKWNEAARALGERHRVFCASLADVFDPVVPNSWRGDLFGLIEDTPHLDWLLLTKRPEHFNDMAVPWGWPRNVWLGVTVENQEQAEKRIPLLAAQEATVRFLSCEPLLGPLDLSQWLDEDRTGFVGIIDWVIIGGESGAGAREFDPAWARSLINQCRDGGRAEAAPFVKQMGARPVGMKLIDPHGGLTVEWPGELRVREFPEVYR